MVALDDPANYIAYKIPIVLRIHTCQIVPQRDQSNRNEDAIETGSNVVFLSIKFCRVRSV